MVSRGIEEAAELGIGEVGDHPIGEHAGLSKTFGVAGGGVEPEQAVGEEGVVFEIGRQLGAAGSVGSQEAAVGIDELGEQEVGGPLGGGCGKRSFLERRKPSA